MAKKKNRNIVLLKSIDELNDEINLSSFSYRASFKHICDLIPNKEQEALYIEAINHQLCAERGLVYIFSIKDKIFKIGHTITSIKERVNSYNCGKTEYRISGTNSTTNYFVLQSLLNIGITVNVHAFFPEKPSYNLFGTEYKDGLAPAKTAEKIIISDFQQTYGKKPIGCTQT